MSLEKLRGSGLFWVLGYDELEFPRRNLELLSEQGR